LDYIIFRLQNVKPYSAQNFLKKASPLQIGMTSNVMDRAIMFLTYENDDDMFMSIKNSILDIWGIVLN